MFGSTASAEGWTIMRFADALQDESADAFRPTFRTLNCHIVRIALACLIGKATYSKNSSTLKMIEKIDTKEAVILVTLPR